MRGASKVVLEGVCGLSECALHVCHDFGRFGERLNGLERFVESALMFHC